MSTYCKRIGCVNGKPVIVLSKEFIERNFLKFINHRQNKTSKSASRMRVLEGQDVLIVFPESFVTEKTVEEIDAKILELLVKLHGKYAMVSYKSPDDDIDPSGHKTKVFDLFKEKTKLMTLL